jgi:restriction system protein
VSSGSQDRSDRSDGSDGSDRSVGSRKRLRPGGGYRDLRSFQAATVVYDATVVFCERFLDRRSRTVDQMIQAARSGRQNIAEGSRASTASSQTELRLVGVARASLDELLLDYEDFLRQRGQRSWVKDDPDSVAVREAARRRFRPTPDDPFGPYAPWLENPDPAVVANAVICLIHQTNYLLDRQLAALERAFIGGGGYSERLASARIAERAKRRSSGPERPIPDCPRCGRPMALRTSRQGAGAGSQFWGCSAFPDCRATLPLDCG